MWICSCWQQPFFSSYLTSKLAPRGLPIASHQLCQCHFGYRLELAMKNWFGKQLFPQSSLHYSQLHTPYPAKQAILVQGRRKLSSSFAPKPRTKARAELWPAPNPRWNTQIQDEACFFPCWWGSGDPHFGFEYSTSKKKWKQKVTGLKVKQEQNMWHLWFSVSNLFPFQAPRTRVIWDLDTSNTY